MKQSPFQQFLSKCGRAAIFVENEMPIGEFHDFLMELKGIMVNRMVAAHQQQLKEAEDQKNLPPLDPPVTDDDSPVLPPLTPLNDSQDQSAQQSNVPASGTQGA